MNTIKAIAFNLVQILTIGVSYFVVGASLLAVIALIQKLS